MLAASAAAPLFHSPLARALQAAATPMGANTADALAQELFASLKPAQHDVLCMHRDHAKRAMVNNNWMIVKQTLGDTLTDPQQELASRTFLALHSETHQQAVLDQVTHDNDGFEEISLAFFGQPEQRDFELVFAGRHMTRRLDLSPESKHTAFGGPMFYGHAAESFNEEPDHPGNAYWFQAKHANTLYRALNKDQQQLALIEDHRKDTPALINLKGDPLGVATETFSSDQLQLLDDTVHQLLSLFRESDQAHARALLARNGGTRALHIAFAQNHDLGEDGIWDNWQLRGPGLSWYFRGKPHVHVWARLEDAS